MLRPAQHERNMVKLESYSRFVLSLSKGERILLIRAIQSDPQAQTDVSVETSRRG
jgi:hypothetical protein